MATDFAARAAALFHGFVTPLIVGGEMHPSRPIGGRVALRLHEHKGAVDVDAFSRVQLARLRRARSLAPLDFIPDPTAAEWTMAAVLHDLVQSTHPGFATVFRRKGPARLLEVARLTLSRVPLAATPKEALLRHTVFQRILELARIDTKVSWWTGSATFLGTKPPPRLLAWPDIRRVQIHRTAQPLFVLPSLSPAVPEVAFFEAMRLLFERSPLTDLATCTRDGSGGSAFTWSRGTLALLGTRAGKTLALRVLRQGDADAQYPPLGVATEALLVAKNWRAAELVMGLLAELVLAEAVQAVGGNRPRLLAVKAGVGAAVARGAGALSAKRVIEQGAFSAPESHALLRSIEPLVTSDGAKRVEALLAAS